MGDHGNRQVPDGLDAATRLGDLYRRTYRLRTLGMGLGLLPVAMVLQERHAGIAAWAWAFFCGLVWPHLAYGPGAVCPSQWARHARAGEPETALKWRTPRQEPAMRRLAASALLLICATPVFAALKPGAVAPTFTAPAYMAGQPYTFDLKASLAKGPVVLYFFPAAFTPGCNAEAAAFSQAIDKFKAQGASVVGVTAGNTERLAEFSKDTEKCAGKFPVAADEGARIAKSYDATMTMKPDLSSRTSYVIGKDGKVVFAFDSMNPNLHVRETLAALATMKTKRAGK